MSQILRLCDARYYTHGIRTTFVLKVQKSADSTTNDLVEKGALIHSASSTTTLNWSQERRHIYDSKIHFGFLALLRNAAKIVSVGLLDTRETLREVQ